MRTNRGFTLLEVIVFMVVISIGMVTLGRIFAHQLERSVDPLMRVKAVAKAQALMDEILNLPFDEANLSEDQSPCGSSKGRSCAGIHAHKVKNDVGDYHDFRDATEPGYPLSVSVSPAGDQFDLPKDHVRRITISAGMPDGNAVTLSAFKANY